MDNLPETEIMNTPNKIFSASNYGFIAYNLLLAVGFIVLDTL